MLLCLMLVFVIREDTKTASFVVLGVVIEDGLLGRSLTISFVNAVDADDDGGIAACTRSRLGDKRTRCNTKSKTAAPQAVVVSL